MTESLYPKHASGTVEQIDTALRCPTCRRVSPNCGARHERGELLAWCSVVECEWVRTPVIFQGFR